MSYTAGATARLLPQHHAAHSHTPVRAAASKDVEAPPWRRLHCRRAPCLQARHLPLTPRPRARVPLPTHRAYTPHPCSTHPGHPDHPDHPPATATATATTTAVYMLTRRTSPLLCVRLTSPRCASSWRCIRASSGSAPSTYSLSTAASVRSRARSHLWGRVSGKTSSSQMDGFVTARTVRVPAPHRPVPAPYRPVPTPCTRPVPVPCVPAPRRPGGYGWSQLRGPAERTRAYSWEGLDSPQLTLHVYAYRIVSLVTLCSQPSPSPSCRRFGSHATPSSSYYLNGPSRMISLASPCISPVSPLSLELYYLSVPSRMF